MGRRKRNKAEQFADEALDSVKSGAHRAVDTAEEFFGKSKRATRKARKKVDKTADKAEKKLARISRKAEKRASRIRSKAEAQVDKVTDRLPD